MLTLKERIHRLRETGKTYNQIVETLGCSKATVSWHCSEDVRIKYRRYRQKNRKKQVVDLKNLHGGKCIRCGYNKCFEALDFHHVDPENKIGTVAYLFMDKGKKAAFDEAKKCILICANCHRETHMEELNA